MTLHLSIPPRRHRAIPPRPVLELARYVVADAHKAYAKTVALIGWPPIRTNGPLVIDVSPEFTTDSAE